MNQTNPVWKRIFIYHLISPLFPPPELPTEFLKPLEDQTVKEKETAKFECEISKPDRSVVWCKDGKDLSPSDRVVVKSEKTKHYLTLKNCVLDDESKYTIKVDGQESTAKLTVEGKYDGIF